MPASCQLEQAALTPILTSPKKNLLLVDYEPTEQCQVRFRPLDKGWICKRQSNVKIKFRGVVSTALTFDTVDLVRGQVQPFQQLSDIDAIH